jgi:hypothetical protein
MSAVALLLCVSLLLLLSYCSIFKFLRNPRKPVILAMSRPDAKKNITTLVKAYGKNKALRDIANLVLIMGNREVRTGAAGLGTDNRGNRTAIVRHKPVCQ